MVEAVRQRIKGAGGILTVSAVLREDLYESKYGDGIYLYVHGIALNSNGPTPKRTPAPRASHRTGHDPSGRSGREYRSRCSQIYPDPTELVGVLPMAAMGLENRSPRGPAAKHVPIARDGTSGRIGASAS
jgi:hypothetical protein